MWGGKGLNSTKRTITSGIMCWNGIDASWNKLVEPVLNNLDNYMHNAHICVHFSQNTKNKDHFVHSGPEPLGISLQYLRGKLFIYFEIKHYLRHLPSSFVSFTRASTSSGNATGHCLKAASKISSCSFDGLLESRELKTREFWSAFFSCLLFFTSVRWNRLQCQ